MKSTGFKIMLLSVVLGLSHASMAQPTDKTLYISNTDIYDLKLNEVKASFYVPYPGANISGICGLEIRADSYRRNQEIKNFLDAIRVTFWIGTSGEAPVEVKNDTTLFWSIPTGGYGYWFEIETKDGKTLKQTIEETLGESRTVLILGSSCL